MLQGRIPQVHDQRPTSRYNTSQDMWYKLSTITNLLIYILIDFAIFITLNPPNGEWGHPAP